MRRTYSQFLTEAEQLASGLVALGVKRGDRVGIWGPNTYEWLLTQYATALAGFILVRQIIRVDLQKYSRKMKSFGFTMI